MNIVVPIKQVPESSNVKMDPETGAVIRAGVETVVNPLDLYAIEVSLRLRDLYGGTVTAVSMGPQQASRALKEALAMGCDAAALLSDRKVGGSDTCATSYALARMMKKLGTYDMIITGERATDGDTAQIGPGIASWLDIPVGTYVSKIDDIRDGRVLAERLTEDGYQIFSTSLPCVLTVIKEIATPRLPTLKGKVRSMEMDIPVYTAQDLELDPQYVGLEGSPTKVVRIDASRIARNGGTITADDEISIAAAADAFVTLVEKKGLLS